MTEQDFTNIFVQDPKYTSPWIGKASAILTKMDGDIDKNMEWVKQYNYEQLVSISDMIDYNKTATDHKIDLNVYANPELNGTQMQVFLNVFQKSNEIDIDFEEALRKIVDPKYTYEMLNWICSALVKGLDLTDHIDTFSPHQISELYSGFEDGVDITKYDDPNIPAYVMNLIRHALGVNYTTVIYDYDTKEITFK